MKQLFILITTLLLTCLAENTNVNSLTITREEIKVKKITTLINQKIKLAETLLKKSDKLIQYGDYDKGKQLAEEVKKIIEGINFLTINKNRYLNIQNSILVAKQVEAEKFAKDSLDKAILFKNEAGVALLNIEESVFLIAIEAAEKWVKDAIEKSKKRFEERYDQIQVTNIENHYVVRLIPKRRDCLWRIAAYDFVYNDGYKWKKIYLANKESIKNPDLIHPGQKLIIPPLD